MMHRNRRRAFAASALFGALVTTSGAQAAEGSDHPSSAETAPPEPLFGRQGHVVLEDVVGVSFTSLGVIPATGAVGFSVGWFSFSTAEVDQGAGGSSASTTFVVAPSLDVFVTDHLTIGGRASGWIGHQRLDGMPSTETYGGGLSPRIGWVLPLGDGVALWPRLQGGVSLGGGDNASSEPGWSAGADGLVVVSLGRHAVLDVGPRLAYARTVGSPDITARSLSLGVAGGLSLVF